MATDQMVHEQRLRAGAEAAVGCIGLGFDLAMDCRLEYCKNPMSGTRLINIDEHQIRDLSVPTGILLPNVPECIKCGEGERVRYRSDVLSFIQMSEQFNQQASLSGKIPSGHFNAAFEYSGQWQKDAAKTKALAFEGVIITLYNIELDKSQIVLSDHVKEAVPGTWDPFALAKFIEKHGTHIITGVKMGGKDVIYVNQHSSSPLEVAEVQKSLEDVAAKRFSDAYGESSSHPEKNFSEAMLERIEHGHTFMDSSTLSIYSHKEDITFFWRRRGGSNKKNIPHDKWCQTVKLEPEVISMSYVPISSLLNGIHGSGFLSYAINLYLRYKPPLEVLYQFLDTQMPRQWAPVFGEHPLSLVKRHQTDACLQFSFLGPKLYVNNSVVDVVKTPITGARLFLEGKRCNQLAIHLQHLSSCPERFQLQYESAYESSYCLDSKFYEKIRWKMFSHVCTEPVESDDDCCIVTGARFDVKKSGLKSVLFLRLYFSRVNDAIVLRKPEWDDSFSSSGAEKSMLSSFASLITGKKKHTEPAAGININSALYPGPGPVPSALFQYFEFVDTKEITRGAEHTPGFWLMSGARLVVVKGKISLCVKYSLLDIDSSDEENTRLLNVTDLELDSFRSCEEMSL